MHLMALKRNGVKLFGQEVLNIGMLINSQLDQDTFLNTKAKEIESFLLLVLD